MDYGIKSNKELAEICEDRHITVDSKNVSKPTKSEYLAAIEKDEMASNEFLNTGSEPVVAKKPEVKISKAQAKKDMYNKYMAKKRVVITQNNDSQTKLQHKTFSWGNKVLGHQTDRVLFGKPWHVRYGALRNIMNASITDSVQNHETGRIDSVSRPAYNVQILTPLTGKEIEVIAKRQTIRDSSIEALI